MQPKNISLGDLSVTALLPYRNPLVQAVVTEAKFFGNKTAQKALGSVLASYLEEHYVNPTILIPIPLSAERYRDRGYNQVEEISKEALKELPPLFSLSNDMLVRIRDTPPQTSRSGLDRRQNLKGAFSVAKPPNSDHTYIVIDDVVTTGATLSEACETLKRAKIQPVIPIALTH